MTLDEAYSLFSVPLSRSVQNVLDAAYRRYAMKQAHAIQAHAIPSVRLFGPFPSSFMLTPLHARIIVSAMVEVGAFN